MSLVEYGEYTPVLEPPYGRGYTTAHQKMTKKNYRSMVTIDHGVFVYSI